MSSVHDVRICNMFISVGCMSIVRMGMHMSILLFDMTNTYTICYTRDVLYVIPVTSYRSRKTGYTGGSWTETQ